jgi:hypothetical protein
VKGGDRATVSRQLDEDDIARIDERAPRRFFAPLIILGYVPVVFTLPWALTQLWREPYLEPIDRLAPLLLPFVLWFVLIFGECAGIDFWLAKFSSHGPDAKWSSLEKITRRMVQSEGRPGESGA